jgi:hypothetical protein
VPNRSAIEVGDVSRAVRKRANFDFTPGAIDRPFLAQDAEFLHSLIDEHDLAARLAVEIDGRGADNPGFRLGSIVLVEDLPLVLLADGHVTGELFLSD